MKPSDARKTFDCLEFKRRVQEEVYEDIKDLSRAEQVEYFRRHAESGPFGSWRRELIHRPDRSPDLVGPPGASPV